MLLGHFIEERIFITAATSLFEELLGILIGFWKFGEAGAHVKNGFRTQVSTLDLALVDAFDVIKEYAQSLLILRHIVQGFCLVIDCKPKDVIVNVSILVRIDLVVICDS